MATEHTNKMRDLIQELLDTIARQEKAIQEQQNVIEVLQKERNELRVKVGTLTQDMGELARNRALPREPTMFEGSSPSVSRMTSPTSPTSGDYENDKSDFESGNVSPRQFDGQEETFSEQHNLAKKEIAHSKTEMEIDTNRVSHAPIKTRHTVGEILTDVDAGTGRQKKFLFPSKRKQSAGDYPPIPPKPAVVSASNVSPKSSPSSKSSRSSNTTSPSVIGSLNPKTSSSKSPTLDQPSPKTTTTRSPTRSPQRSSYSKSRTIKKSEECDADNDRFASRCATMGSQQAFHEHHMNKKRRRKSSDKATRRFTTIDNGNPPRVTGSSLLSKKINYQFSADMEERLQLKIEQGIQNTYGPIEKCIQAAITIQRCYRQQKMVQRFKTLRKEVISVAALQPSRPRAASVRLPQRAYSIRLKTNPDAKVSILDEFPEYRNLTNRIASRGKIGNHPLQTSVDSTSKDLGPNVRWRREASLEIQETLLEIPDKSVTPVRALSISDDVAKDDVFTPSPTPSPERLCSQSPSSDPGQDIMRKVSSVPISMSVDFLTSHEEEQLSSVTRPHSISIMHHITRSRSMEELLVMDNATGKPQKPRLKQQESATSLKKKTNIGITLFNRKPAKGILYMVLQGILQDSPKDVADFVRTQYGLSKAMIGKFFSELHNEFSMAVLEALIDSMNFVDKPIDEALRSLQEVFQITGEAQLIERIMSVFAVKYFNDNASGVVSSEDAGFVLSYAIMMLNTDLHSPHVRHHMSPKQWIKMNKGNNNGKDYPEAFLLQIYERIQKEQFRPGKDHLTELEALQRTITGVDCPKIAVPHRQFKFQLTVNEIAERGPLVFATHHSRVLFIFSDVLLVCKSTGAKKLHPTYMFRSCISLLNTVVIQCDSLKKYKHGVQLVSSIDGKKLITCSCDNAVNQTQLMKKLNESIQELTEIEQLRIATQSHQQTSGRRSSISKDRLGSQKKVSGPLIVANERHELSSEAMVICRSNTLVKSGSFPAISELAESDSLSDVTIASSPPLSSSAEQATELPSNNQGCTTTGRLPSRSKTPPKGTRYAVNTLDSSPRTAVKSPPISSSPKSGTGFLRRLKGKSSGGYTVNT